MSPVSVSVGRISRRRSSREIVGSSSSVSGDSSGSKVQGEAHDESARRSVSFRMYLGTPYVQWITSRDTMGNEMSLKVKRRLVRSFNLDPPERPRSRGTGFMRYFRHTPSPLPLTQLFRLSACS